MDTDVDACMWVSVLLFLKRLHCKVILAPAIFFSPECSFKVYLCGNIELTFHIPVFITSLVTPIHHIKDFLQLSRQPNTWITPTQCSNLSLIVTISGKHIEIRLRPFQCMYSLCPLFFYSHT